MLSVSCLPPFSFHGHSTWDTHFSPSTLPCSAGPPWDSHFWLSALAPVTWAESASRSGEQQDSPAVFPQPLSNIKLRATRRQPLGLGSEAAPAVRCASYLIQQMQPPGTWAAAKASFRTQSQVIFSSGSGLYT